METLSEEVEVRNALLNYLLMVKEFYAKLYTPEIMTKMEALLPVKEVPPSPEPHEVLLGRAEKRWLQRLFVCLTTIEQTMANIEHWRNWFFKLLRTIEFDEEHLPQLMNGQEFIFQELQKRNLDEGYVRLVINNATTDFMELIRDSRRLLEELVELEAFLQSLQSPMLEIVETRLSRTKETALMGVLNHMQQLLVATYNAPTQKDLLYNLALLLGLFGEWRRLLQMDDPALDDPNAMKAFIKETKGQINKMGDLTRAFKGFVEMRNLTDYYIRQAELSIIRMMLSYGGDADQWWNTYIEAKTEEVQGFIPETLDPHQLLIGVTHSLALLEDLDQRMLPQMPTIKTTVWELGAFLHSPALRQYEEITQQRLGFWDEYHTEWVKLLVKLRNALHAQIKKEQH